MGGARGCWRFVVGDADFADSPLIILLLVCASAIGLTGLRAKKSPVIFLLFFLSRSTVDLARLIFLVFLLIEVVTHSAAFTLYTRSLRFLDSFTPPLENPPSLEHKTTF